MGSSGPQVSRLGGVRYVLPGPATYSTSFHPQPQLHIQQPRWSRSTFFGLFLLLVSIATINVFIVSFVWERFARLEEEENLHAKTIALENSAGGLSSSATYRSVILYPRKVSAEDWTRKSLLCRFEDCSRARDMALTLNGTAWPQQDFKACTSGLFSTRAEDEVPTSNSTLLSPQINNVIPVDSPCVRNDNEDVVSGEECRRPSWKAPHNQIVVYVESPSRVTNEESLFRELLHVLKHDETFSAGLGAHLIFTASKAADWDIRLRSSPDKAAGRLRVETTKVVEPSSKHCVKRKWTITINANARAHPNALFGALREATVRAIQQIRSEANVRMAIFLIWAGAKPPPVQLLDVAKGFVRSDSRKVTVLLMIEGQYADHYKAIFAKDKTVNSGIYKSKIRLIHHYDDSSNGNLTKFIHSRADMLVPSIKGHHQYALGWSLCDFRWLFGAIFDKFIPESEFTHWAWADSDAFPGKLFGPVSDYGYDFERHDVTSFAATILERNSPASSMMGYSSGTFTVIKNNRKGRELFYLTPKEKLDRALTRPSNGILDEVGTSNAVFGAPNVSIALIGSQARVAGTIFDEESGKLYFVAESAQDSKSLSNLRSLARMNEPFALAPMGFATVLARFAGGVALPGQIRYVHPDDKVRWYQPPRVNPDHFLNLLAPGAGFATLLRDQQGYWWNRPLPFEFVHRSRNRNLGAFQEARPIVRMEIGIVHSRLEGPCVVRSSKDVFSFDWTLASQGFVSKPASVDFNSKQCSPFKKFFKA